MRHWSQWKCITKLCLGARQINRELAAPGCPSKWRWWQEGGPSELHAGTGWSEGPGQGDIIPTVWNSEAVLRPRRRSEAAASLNWIQSHQGRYFTPERELLRIGWKMLCSGLNKAGADLGKSLLIQREWMNQTKQTARYARKIWKDWTRHSTNQEGDQDGWTRAGVGKANFKRLCVAAYSQISTKIKEAEFRGDKKKGRSRKGNKRLSKCGSHWHPVR